MPDSDAALRRDHARRAALIRWALEPDRTAATSAAREARWAAYERRVDPDGLLRPAERRKRAKSLQDADMAAMRLARSRRRQLDE